jgi:Na+/H+ antiporter NhaA
MKRIGARPGSRGRPREAWRQGLTGLGLTSLSVLAGLGFTMSLFIAQLAFEGARSWPAARLPSCVRRRWLRSWGLVMMRLVAARQG